MKKKILLGSIAVVFMLVAISFASAVNTERTVDKKESPLFKMRTQKAINEENKVVKEKINNFFTKFIKNRVFLRIPLINKEHVFSLNTRGGGCTLDKTWCDRDLNQNQGMYFFKIKTNCCTYPWNTCYPNC